MIEANVLNTMLQTGILAITVPVVLIAVWKMRTRKSLVPFFVGVLIFLLFAKGLEMIPHTIFLLMDNPVSRAINGNVVLYALYGGMMAGLFEEMGRYVAFHFLLKKYPEKETAVTYGIGHGGMECILVLGIGYLQYYTYGQLINSGTMDKMMASYEGNPEMLTSLKQLIDTITGMHRSDCWMAGWERISALMIQVALSILVYQAVKITEKKYMLWVAVVLHMLMDIPAALYQKGVLAIVPTEVIMFLFAGAVLFFAVRLYSGLEGEKISEADAAQKHSLHQMANQRLKKQADSSEKKS